MLLQTAVEGFESLYPNFHLLIEVDFDHFGKCIGFDKSRGELQLRIVHPWELMRLPCVAFSFWR